MVAPILKIKLKGTSRSTILKSDDICIKRIRKDEKELD